MSLNSDAITEILQLYSRYSTAIDTGDGAAFANCFVPDGVFDNGMAVIEGRADIAGFADQTHSAMPGMRHDATNIVLDGIGASGNKATGSAFLIGYLVDGGYKVIVTGRYIDELEKVVDGWRFTKRVFTMDGTDATDGQSVNLLSPYRVLDLTDVRGQIAGMILGDLGADVIRIEPPIGSEARRAEPLLESGPELATAA